jgi:acetyl esterase/lipase
MTACTIKMIAVLLGIVGVGLAGDTHAKQAVQVKKNIVYTPQGEKLDLCQPIGAHKKTTVIFVHGGGFSSGSKRDLLGLCKLFAQGGFVGVTINYRLAPQNSFPAAVDDTSAAIAWMKNGAERFGTDPAKVVVMGYSAGATLALSAGMAKESRVAAIIDVAGITDFELLRATTPYEKLRKDIDAYLGDTTAVTASPLSLVTAQTPPVFIFHGEQDQLVAIVQSVVLAQHLKAKNTSILFRAYPGAGHDILLPGKHFRALLTDVTHYLLAIEAR